MFIKSKNKNPLVRGVILAVLLTLIGASPAAAARYDVCLVANEFTDATTGVPMWGYGQLDCALWPFSNAVADTAVPSVPGPRIEVPPGDWLLVRVKNRLQVPTSFGISGMVKRSTQPMAPVFTPVDAQGRKRIISLDRQIAPNGRTNYQFRRDPGVGVDQPGTFLYGSVAHQQVQRQMGLYGVVTQDSAAGEAYPGVSYQAEEVLVYSEVDPTVHAEVADNGLLDGSVTPGMTSTFDYKPEFFLLNGEHRPYLPSGSAGALDIPADANQNVLLRIVNAGLRTVVPNILGMRCSVVAEDGNPYPYPRDQYSMEVWAGSTRDCIVNSPVDGTFPIVERRTTGLNGAGGQMAFLTVGAPAGGAPIAVADSFVATEDTQLNVAANGVLGNDSGTGTLTAILVSGTTNGTLVLNADGSFTYDPAVNFNGSDSFTYRVNDGTNNSNVVTASITVNPANDAPVAVADAYTVPSGTPTTIPVPGVLANDTDVDGDSLSTDGDGVTSIPTLGGSVVLFANGSFAYTPNTGTTSDSFTYTAFDGVANSAPATVNITVQANSAPVAVADTYNTLRGVPLNIAAPGVLGNDSDPEGDPISATGNITSVNGGTVAVNPDGSFSYTNPTSFIGDDTFSYTVSDGFLSSVVTTVTITVENNAPVAADNSAWAPRRRSGDIPGTRNTCLPVFINLVANDSDVDGPTPTSVTIVNQPSSGGSVTVDGAGIATYLGAVNFRGTETFTYTVADSDAGISNLATVTVNVVGQRSFKRRVGLPTSGPCTPPLPVQ